MSEQPPDRPRRGRYLIFDAHHRLTLSVIAADGRVSKCLVNDVSPFGLGVRAAEPSAPGGTVHVRYLDGGTEVEVLGYVVWCKASEEVPSAELDGYHGYPFRCGISFDPSDRHTCDALYAALQGQCT